MKIEVLPNGMTRHTFNDGVVANIMPHPYDENKSVISPVSKFEIFDLGTDIPQAPDSEKLIEMFKRYKEEVPKKNSSRFGIPFFKGLEIFLEDYGFQSTPLPWRYQSDRYTINQVEDSDGNEEVNPTIYTISITSDDEQVYRGKLFNSTHAAYIFGMVAERKLLTGKDDFPKLPIEPIKFAVGRTSVWADEERTDELYPETMQEVIETTCSNDAYKTFNLRTKEFHTAAELIRYMKLVKHPIVIENEWGSCTDSGLPRLEIYDDYRE